LTIKDGVNKTSIEDSDRRPGGETYFLKNITFKMRLTAKRETGNIWCFAFRRILKEKYFEEFCKKSVWIIASNRC